MNKMYLTTIFCTILSVKLLSVGCIIFVIPEDVPTGLVAIYGFSPRIVKGNDHRFGLGFRLGNHADFQLLYELGPQTITKPIPSLRVRSTTNHQRMIKRRPLVDFLLRVGFIKQKSFEHDVEIEKEDRDDEPR